MANKDQQVRRVAEGLGAGLLACGVTAVRSNQRSVESNFAAAWRTWSRSGEFPSLSKDPGGLLWLELGKSARRQLLFVVWNRSQWSAPRPAQAHWTSGDCLEELTDGRASGSDWRRLATAFVAGFDDADINRE